MNRDDAVRAALNSWCGKTQCDWPDDPCDVHVLTADLVRERDADRQRWSALLDEAGIAWGRATKRADDAERERDEALAEVERARREADYEAGGWDAHDKVLARAEKAEAAEAALREISEWDMLNPPQTDLVSDLAWLRAVVDRGLGGTS